MPPSSPLPSVLPSVVPVSLSLTFLALALFAPPLTGCGGRTGLSVDGDDSGLDGSVPDQSEPRDGDLTDGGPEDLGTPDMDVVTRLLAEGMSKRLGVPVQVINKPGGGGVVGFAEMVRAKPDGYTIGTWTPGPGISQIVAGNTPYKMADYQAGMWVWLRGSA